MFACREDVSLSAVWRCEGRRPLGQRRREECEEPGNQRVDLSAAPEYARSQNMVISCVGTYNCSHTKRLGGLETTTSCYYYYYY